MSKTVYMREYMKRRYHERRVLAIATLGGKCARCPVTRLLEIDHIDPATKTMSFKQMRCVSMKRFIAELKKCQLLCRQCHGQKSIVDHGHVARAHGNIAMYRHGKCRCAACVRANSAYQQRRKKMKVGGHGDQADSNTAGHSSILCRPVRPSS